MRVHLVIGLASGLALAPITAAAASPPSHQPAVPAPWQVLQRNAILARFVTRDALATQPASDRLFDLFIARSASDGTSATNASAQPGSSARADEEQTTVRRRDRSGGYLLSGAILFALTGWGLSSHGNPLANDPGGDLPGGGILPPGGGDELPGGNPPINPPANNNPTGNDGGSQPQILPPAGGPETVTPEPVTLTLLASGLVGIGAADTRRRWRRRQG